MSFKKPGPTNEVGLVEQKQEVIKPANSEAGEVVDKKNKLVDLVETVSRLAEKFDSAEAKKALKDLQNEQDILSQEKVATIRKILEILKIYRMRELIGVPTGQDFEDGFVKVDKILEEMSQESNRGEQLVDLQQKILTEASGIDTEIENSASYRRVENLAAKYNTLFVHNFWQKKESSSAGPHSVVDAAADWQTKLKIILAVNPTISTSSLREGSPKEKPYFSDCVGIILKKGEVRSATSGGEVSTSVSGGERSGHLPDEKELKDALIDNRGSGSNEVVVTMPEAAGIIISDDSDLFSKDNPINNLELARQVSALAFSLGRMPIYIRKSGNGADGKFYKAVFDSDTGGLRAGQLVTAEEITNSQFELSAERKRRLQEEIFEGCPFKLDLPEKYFIDEHRFGAKNYSAIVNNEVVYASRSFSPELGAISTPEDHIKQVLAVAKSRKDYLSNIKEEDSNTQFVEQTNQLLKENAWYLYGFAEAAKIAGDLASYDAATSAAMDIFSKDEYDKIIQERRGKNGRFKMTVEDLKTVRSS